LGGTFGTQGARHPAALQPPYQYNNAIRRTNSLNNVAPGTIISISTASTTPGTRGTTFTVSTAAMSPSPQHLQHAREPPNFVENADRIFSNVALSAIIIFT
jgi:aspartokinase